VPSFSDNPEFDPEQLTPNASINRALLQDVPWLAEELNGREAFGLMGRPYLVEQAIGVFPELAQAEDPIVDLNRLCSEGNEGA
jgi:hypothetical protein